MILLIICVTAHSFIHILFVNPSERMIKLGSWMVLIALFNGQHPGQRCVSALLMYPNISTRNPERLGSIFKKTFDHRFSKKMGGWYGNKRMNILSCINKKIRIPIHNNY